MTDRERFFRSLSAVLGEDGGTGGIGTLGEKALHATLKRYIDEDPLHHEQKVGGFFADVRNEEGIFEIQTRGFDRLRRKLEVFLPECPVTVVYPIAHIRRLSYINPEDGTLSGKRKSPKVGRLTDVIPELYKIRPYITYPNFRLRLILLDCDEYKTRGTGRGRRNGSTHFERIPYDIVEDTLLASPEDFRCFVSDTLPQGFTSAQFAVSLKIHRPGASTLLLLLTELGVVTRCGKKGNSILYSRTEKAEET